MSFPYGMGRSGDRGPLTPALFAFVVGRLVYYPTFYPGLPRLIVATLDGDTGPVSSAIATLFDAKNDPRTGTRLSLRAAVDCRDRPRFHDSPAPSDGVTDMTTLFGICDAWAPLGPPPLVPSGTVSRVRTTPLPAEYGMPPALLPRSGQRIVPIAIFTQPG